MLMQMLTLLTQSTIEVTPSLNSLTLTTASLGTCLTTPLQPASIRLNWTATNFLAGVMDYKVYRDGVLVDTRDTDGYVLGLAGLVENDNHHAQVITFNYRIDIVQTSNGSVLATRSISVSKNYGNCV